MQKTKLAHLKPTSLEVFMAEEKARDSDLFKQEDGSEYQPLPKFQGQPLRKAQPPTLSFLQQNFAAPSLRGADFA